MATPKCFCFMPIATVATCSAAQTNTHTHTYTHTCVCAWHVELLGWLVLMRLEFCRVRLLWEKLKISSGPQVVSRICIKRMQPARKRGGREREVDRERGRGFISIQPTIRQQLMLSPSLSHCTQSQPSAHKHINDTLGC